jgi:hypothetical protein
MKAVVSQNALGNQISFFINQRPAAERGSRTFGGLPHTSSFSGGR